MEQETTDDRGRKRKIWLIVFSVSLFALAIFWSIDPSIIYILTGLSAFCFYQVLQTFPFKPKEPSYPGDYQQSYAKRPSIWDELKFKFTNPSSKQSPGNSARIVRTVIAIFVGLVFLSIIIPIIFSDDPDYRAEQAEQLAGQFYDTQQYDSAAYYYRIAIAGNSERADLYYKRGNAFVNLNNYDSAAILYNRAIELQPGYKEAYYMKGWIFFNAKNYTDALKVGRQAFELDPDYDEAMLLIGDCFYNTNKSDSALIWYEQAYEEGYRSAALSNIMADIYYTKGDPQKAIPLYKEAISYDTTLAGIYQRLGELISGEDGNWYRQKAAQYPQQ